MQGVGSYNIEHYGKSRCFRIKIAFNIDSVRYYSHLCDALQLFIFRGWEYSSFGLRVYFDILVAS